TDVDQNRLRIAFQDLAEFKDRNFVVYHDSSGPGAVLSQKRWPQPNITGNESGDRGLGGGGGDAPPAQEGYALKSGWRGVTFSDPHPKLIGVPGKVSRERLTANNGRCVSRKLAEFTEDYMA